MNKARNRRQFLFAVGASGVAVLSAQSIHQTAFAAEMEAVDPSGPQAMALGYVTDGTTTDTAKFARYEATQRCDNCQLYQGEVGSESGGCLLFSGKSVQGAGWCNSWVLKAS
jgi:hypothetical protein